MKRFVIALLAGFALAAGAGVFGASPAGMSNFALGVVQNVDRSGSAVTVAHEPVAALNWPAMAMQFKVGEAALCRRGEEQQQEQHADRNAAAAARHDRLDTRRKSIMARPPRREEILRAAARAACRGVRCGPVAPRSVPRRLAVPHRTL